MWHADRSRRGIDPGRVPCVEFQTLRRQLISGRWWTNGLDENYSTSSSSFIIQWRARACREIDIADEDRRE